MRLQPSAGRIEPLLLLLAAGGLIGLIFPLGKLAAGQGLPPLLYAGMSAAGASLVLGAIAWLSGARLPASRTVVLYALVAGQLTFAIPFGMLVLVIPHLGSAIPAVLQSLAPVLTLAIVCMLGLERPNLVRAAGLASGLAGALIILLSRSAATPESSAPLGWYLAALATPLALAAGNVYRTTAWPQGERPIPLAALTLAAAAIFLLAAFRVAAGREMDVSAALRSGWRLILLQSLATGIGYAFFFRLQQVGGPVYLSQISYVNTGVGVAFALLFFSEELTVWTWLAVLLVFAGVALVSRAQPPSPESRSASRLP